jgi:hypothetical protein
LRISDCGLRTELNPQSAIDNPQFLKGRSSMFTALRHLDRLLRGEATRPDAIPGGKLQIPVAQLALVIVALGVVYGACMGLYALTGEHEVADPNRWMQIPATMLKVPALFLLTMIVTLPSLYVFNALVGSRLLWGSVLKLLTAAVAVMLAVLASLGPIVAFFAVSTTSYPFMLLLNVAMFTIAGVLGLKFLLQTLHRLTTALEQSEDLRAATESPTEVAAPPVPGEPPPIPVNVTLSGQPLRGALTPTGRPGGHVKAVFRIWLVVFALVGAQMGWVMRPFVGNPHQKFTWFRQRESNFFEAVVRTTLKLFDGEKVKSEKTRDDSGWSR